MQAIGVGMLAFGLQGTLRFPKGRDVVVNLLLGRNLN